MRLELRRQNWRGGTEIGGFCYYHYWFNGKLLLEKPHESVITDREPDFPFCVCWANEDWSRTWDGRGHQVLITGDLEHYDPDAHFEYLRKLFFDPRYIRIDDNPLFLVYRIDEFSDIRSTISQCRANAKAIGLPGIYLCAIQSHMHKLDNAQTLALGFGATVGFEPHAKTFRPQLVASCFRYSAAKAFRAERV